MIRKETSIPAYLMMDAGPNVKWFARRVIFQRFWKSLAKYLEENSSHVLELFPLTEDEWNASCGFMKYHDDYFKSSGKLFIAGEYAVVEPGHGAIVAAVLRY